MLKYNIYHIHENTKLVHTDRYFFKNIFHAKYTKHVYKKGVTSTEMIFIHLLHTTKACKNVVSAVKIRLFNVNSGWWIIATTALAAFGRVVPAVQVLPSSSKKKKKRIDSVHHLFYYINQYK